MDQEKRASPRVEFQGRIVLYLGDQQVVGKGNNLSASGVLLQAPLPAPIGKTLKLALSLRPSQWVNIEARVVRQAESSTAVAWGLEFVRLSRDLASVLGDYVAGRLGLTAAPSLPAAERRDRTGERPDPTAGGVSRRVSGPFRPVAAAPAARPSERRPTGSGHPVVPERSPAERRPTGTTHAAVPPRAAAERRPTGSAHAAVPPAAPAERRPTGTAHAAVPPRAAPSPSGLFSKLRTRIAAAWTGGEKEASSAPSSGTSEEPHGNRSPAPRPTRPTRPLGAAVRPTAEATPPRGAPRPAGPLRRTPSDVPPHDELDLSAVPLDSLYREALEDMDPKAPEKFKK